jgi:Tfp pilus assembly protein PilN
VRPVNLIPSDERRGDGAAMRTGAFSYVLIAGLSVALLAVIAFALTSKQISDRKSEVAQLTQEEQQVTARAQSLQAFADFRAMQESRSATVTSLAQSRFDWDRVLRELALVIPDDVWLTELSGTVSPDVQLTDGPEIQLRADAPGPALAIVGCAASHEAVASFLQALRDIDGVTRVAISSDARPDDSSESATSGGASDTDCRTRDFISRFEAVAAFDAVAVPASATTPAAPAVPATPSADGVGDVQAEEQKVRDSTAQQTEKAQQAVDIVTGVAH